MKWSLPSQPEAFGAIFWFTGLSGSGKTSLSRAVSRALSLQGRSCLILDADELRRTLSRDLGFSRADRRENVRRIFALAHAQAKGRTLVLVASIAPFRDQRECLRSESAVPFLEIFVDAPLEVCEDRDPKGLYRKARAGLIPLFTGIDDLYEVPISPDLHCFTATETVDQSCRRVMAFLQTKLPPSPHHPDLNGPCKLASRIRAAGSLLWSMRAPRMRSEALTRLLFRQRHFQATTHTLPQRYPALFAQCRESLAHIPTPRILSFGCSTGEEAASLRHYLPQADIIGVDINKWCLRQAEQKLLPRTRFLHCDSEEFSALQDLDAIFCLAVFQRTEHRIQAPHFIAAGFTFERFEQAITLLDSKLKPGGVLFLDHCDFRFENTAASSSYDPLISPATLRVRKRPIFDSSNRLLATEHLATRIYRKRLLSSLVASSRGLTSNE